MDAAVRAARRQGRIIADGKETIVALASGRAPSAIAVIRSSGPRAWDVASELTRRSLPAPRVAALRAFRDPATGQMLDQGLLLLFAGDASPTGEPVAEYHCHGGPAVISAMLGALISLHGVRMAEAGDFTWRAFTNGCMDLTKVEGLGDLLNAETETQRRFAVRAHSGEISRLIADWRTSLIDVAARVEATLDFADEGDVELKPEYRSPLSQVSLAMDDALASRSSRVVKDGLRLVVAGPPNAGKSTLVNRLIGRDAMIVSPVAGTTRDLVEHDMVLAGLPVRVADTAGLREKTSDPIEAIGIERASSALAAADIILWLGDEPPPSERSIAVHPRCDLDGRASAPSGRLAVSAVTGAGMDLLLQKLEEAAAAILPAEDAVLLNDRQWRNVQEARLELGSCLSDVTDPLLVAEHLRRAVLSLDRTLGLRYADDMLSAIFSRFCIGK